MTLTIPEVLGGLGLAFTVVALIWRRLDTVSEAIRKENREAFDEITTRIDDLWKHMDAKFDGFSARIAAVEKEAELTRGKLEGLAQGGGRFAASALDRRREERTGGLLMLCPTTGTRLRSPGAGGDADEIRAVGPAIARARFSARPERRRRRQHRRAAAGGRASEVKETEAGGDMCKNCRRVAVALVLATVAGSVQPVHAQDTQEQETVVGEGSTGKVPYYVAEVPFQLYETPPEPVPFFRFLLWSPNEKDLVMDRGTSFLVLERRVINRLGERSLWWRVEEMRTTEEQQGHPTGMRTTEEQGRLAGWIYAGFEPAGGVDDSNLNQWWSLEGVVDAPEAGLRTSKTTGR